MRSLVIGCVLVAFWSVSAQGLAFAAPKNNTADRRDEKRENERVEKARKALQAAESAARDDEKQLASANSELTQLRASAKKLGLALGRTRNEVTERLEKLGKIPELLAERDAAQADYDKRAKPVLAALHASEPYRAAQADASAALTELQRIRGTSEASAKTADGTTAGKVLLKRTLAPAELETAAVDAVPEMRGIRERIKRLQDQIATARKRIATEAETSSEVRGAERDLKAEQQKVDRAEREVLSARQKLEGAAAKVARERQDLAQAVEADRRDSNNNSKKGKK